jgi:ring-1,2-phenylacetyl-CoA epoxidase subunit PaaE
MTQTASAHQFYPLTILEAHKETNDAIVLRLAIPDELRDLFAWQPGQHLTFRRQIKNADGRSEEIRRSYSICSAPSEANPQVLVKRIEGGRFSEPAQQLQAGDTLEVMPPSGHFVLEPEEGRHYVGIAAGSGITPIMGMLQAVLENTDSSHFSLLYGNATTDSILFLEKLADLKDRYPQRLSIFHTISREPVDIPLLSGRIDAEKLQCLHAAEFAHTQPAGYYLCGPGNLITDLSAALQALGEPASKIHHEQFLSEGQEIAPQQKKSRQDSGVTVTVDGVTHRFAIKKGEEKTLLEAAQDAGVELPYSCTAGVCATCRCKLKEGQVDLINNYCLEPWELEQDYILSCQAVPRSEKITLSYDE